MSLEGGTAGGLLPWRGVRGVLLSLRFKLQGHGIDTVAQARGRGAIVKYMTQVGITFRAEHFCPFHKETKVIFFGDRLIIHRLPIARPASTRIKLRLRGKQGRTAAHTIVGAFPLKIVIFTRKGPLGAMFAGNFVGLWGKLRLPFGVSFDNFVGHGGVLSPKVGLHCFVS